MKAFARILLGCVLTSAAPIASTIAKPTGHEVLVSSDAVTSQGFRPSPGNPVYYVFKQSYHFLGYAVAGIKLPDPTFVEKTVEAELTKQGFVQTQIGGPIPSVFILVLWGDANFTPNDDPVDFLKLERPKIENIVGTYKPSIRTVSDAHKIAEASNEDRVYISVAAFEAGTFKDPKTRRLLWRTSMSMDWRTDFTIALPTMLTSGGPSFGTDVKTPIFMDDRDRRQFDVKIGETQEVSAPPSAPAARKK